MKNISIYYHLNDGNHKIDISEGNNIARDFCNEMAVQAADGVGSTIQMGTADGVCLYNSLNSEPIEWEDLKSYFAQNIPERTLIGKPVVAQ